MKIHQKQKASEEHIEKFTPINNYNNESKKWKNQIKTQELILQGRYNKTECEKSIWVLIEFLRVSHATPSENGIEIEISPKYLKG